MSTSNIIYLVLLLIALVLHVAAGRNRNYYSTIIIIYLSVILLVSIIAFVMVKAGVQNNLFLFHVYTPVEYMILALLYRHVVSNATLKKSITVSIPGFIVLSAVLSLFVQPITENNSLVTIIESLLIIAWSLFYLREVLLLQQVTHLQRFPMFWISVGLLFYFTGCLITEGMLNYLIKHSMAMAKRVYSFSHVFKCLLLIMLIIGAWCQIAFREWVSPQHPNR